VLASPITRLIEQRCKDLCGRLGLAQVYVTQILGRRRHFLAGYGRPLPCKPEQMLLSPHLIVFWQGELAEPAREILRTNLQNLTDFVEQQLVESGQGRSGGSAPGSDEAMWP